MKRESRGKKLNGIIRLTGAGAILMAMIGLITFSPLAAGARNECGNFGAGAAGGHHFGAVNAGPRLGPGLEGGIEFLRIVLDLSDSQVKEIEPIIEEHREKTAGIRGEGRRTRRDMRINRMHGRHRCDNVDRTEMRANMRRQRREFEKDREEIRESLDRNREEFEEKLSGLLDNGQMKKFRELRELRGKRRAERQKHREERQEQREERHERRGRKA
jgi:hypothetical protein